MTTTTPPTRRVTELAAPDNAWRAHAACANHDDPDLFFPIGWDAPQQTADAKKICYTCPVIDRCLQWALATRQDAGVWGGLSEDERRRLHRRRKPVYRAGEKTAVDHILENRLGEFQALEAQGLETERIARELGTNIQTVNRVRERLAASEVVKAA